MRPPAINHLTLSGTSIKIIIESHEKPRLTFTKKLFPKQNYHVVLNNELCKFHQHLRREYDETEAYLRHRQRVHEREKRDKLKKEGKLKAYLEQKAKEEPPTPPPPKPVEPTPTWDFNDVIEKYKEIKQLDEDTGLKNLSKFDVDEKKVEVIVKRLKSKKKIEIAKKARLEADPYCEIEDPEEFRPKMAGQTGLPTFFFSNLVKQNRSAFQKADARNRMINKIFPRKPVWP